MNSGQNLGMGRIVGEIGRSCGSDRQIEKLRRVDVAKHELVAAVAQGDQRRESPSAAYSIAPGRRPLPGGSGEQISPSVHGRDVVEIDAGERGRASAARRGVETGDIDALRRPAPARRSSAARGPSPRRSSS
jgi:hypothetical protein